ncbi:AMP-binding protein [Deinococcus altitudinis]|uniref:AMP-binding protein n=1 Tax=Deinococcus altitudinis TaxID=468914 RepID=UPI003891786C
MKRPLTPLDFVRRAIKLYPERTAILHGDLRYSYRQWGERVWRLAHALRDAGIRPGDHVAVLSPNTHQGLLSYSAVPWIGAVLVPLNTRLTAPEYAFQLEFADVKLLLCDATLLERAREVAAALGIEVWIMGEGAATQVGGGQDFEARLQEAASDPLPFPLDLDEDSPITINFTSGTTSSPKGVMLTHRNAYMDGIGVLLYMNLTQDSVYLHTLPNFHVNGWGGVWAMQGVGAANVMLPAVRADTIYEAIGRHGVTHMCAAPTVLSMLTDPASARRVPPLLVATAGSPPHARIITDMDALGFTVLQVYGLSETSPLITVAELNAEQQALPIEERAPLIARQGFEMVNAGEVEVMDADMRPVPHDGSALGEIMVQSNHVMLGYYKNPQATAEAFAGGWFHTGDMASVHPDGRIEIKDRNKDVIISGGENISSVEVEGVLYRHPAVREAVVVAMPHDTWGEVGCAFVALHAGHAVTDEELTAFAREHLAGFKVPKRFEYLDDLPKTASGKFQKFVLRNTLWEGQVRGVN